MSRYEVNKVVREMVMQRASLERFLADPHGFLADRPLEAEERRALAERDFGALYAMGAHPFLLWGWANRVAGIDRETLLDRYAEAVRPHGYPDFAT